MPFLIGCAIAVVVCTLALLAGFDKDRAFYPTTLVVVGSYYVLFAAIGASPGVIAVETVGLAVFVIAAGLGHRFSGWITAAGLAAHGVLDAFHGQLVTNPGVPVWWPAFCGAYDVAAALFLASLLIVRSSSPRSLAAQ